MFGRLFKIQFKMRSKRAYTMILIQFVAALALTIFTFVRFSNWHFYLTNDTSVSFFPEILTIFLFFAFFIGFFYYLFTIIQNERANRNQSLRLIPLSDSKYYLNNILSSFTASIYFVFLEVVCLALLTGISCLLDNNFRQSTIYTLNYQVGPTLPLLHSEFYLTVANLFFILILFCFYIYFIVSFLNFTSRTIMNFLPGTSNQVVLGITRIIVILLIAWLISRAFNFLGTIINSNDSFFSGNGIGKSTISDLAIANIWLFVIDTIFLAADLFLFAKFFEPRERK